VLIPKFTMLAKTTVMHPNLVPHHSAFHILSSGLFKSHGEPSYTLMITQIQSKLIRPTYSGLQQLMTTRHWGILRVLKLVMVLSIKKQAAFNLPEEL